MAFAAVMIGTMAFFGALPAGLLVFDLPGPTALLAAFATSQVTFALVLAKAALCRALRASGPRQTAETVSAWAYAPQLTRR